MHQGYDLKYLQLLSKQYPTIDDVTTEVINLSAIINLPKGTEHFLTDIHGEHEAFDHVMRNASGVVKRKNRWHIWRLTDSWRKEEFSNISVLSKREAWNDQAIECWNKGMV